MSLSVGVVGHRLDKLSAEALPTLQAQIDRVLDSIAEELAAAHSPLREWFTRAGPGVDGAGQAATVVLVSSLAEGADRMAARAARARNIFLDVPLPFPEAEYEADFETKASREEFHRLLKQARSISILPGSRQTEREAAMAYEIAGHTVISQADLLLAVWDGQPGRGRGGTADLIATAASLGMPIILIDAKALLPTEMIWRGLVDHPIASEHFEDLPRTAFEPVTGHVIRSLLAPPNDPAELNSLRAYLVDRRPRSIHRPEWNLLTGLFGLRWPRGRGWLSEPVESGRNLAHLVPHVRAAKIFQAFGWADALAVRHAHTFRGAFIFNFLAAFLAVFCAAMAVSAGHHPVFAMLEVCFVLCVIVNTSWGWRRRWHSRWFEAREVAERLRAALPLWLLGMGPITPRGGEVTWTGWYVRSLLREQPLCAGSLAGPGFRAVRDSLLAILAHQAEYHRRSCKEMHALNWRLELTGLALLGAALVAAMYSLWGLNSPGDAEGAHWLLAPITIVFPVCASAIYGIRLIGDFEGIAQRSTRALKALEELQRAITQDPDDLKLLRARAKAAADAMLGDVEAWRMAAEGRGLAIPG